MTDTELDVLNYAIKFDGLLTTEGYITASTAKRVREVILELVADMKQTRDELRQAKAERDWLAEHRPARYCPTVEKWETCLVDVPGHKLPIACIQCWIARAKEAVCPTKT